MTELEKTVKNIWDNKENEIKELVEDFLGFVGESSVLKYPEKLVVDGMSTLIKYKSLNHSPDTILLALERINKKYVHIKTSEQKIRKIISQAPISKDMMDLFKDEDKQPKNLKRIKKDILITYMYIEPLEEEQIVGLLSRKIKELRKIYSKTEIIKSINLIFRLNFNNRLTVHIGKALKEALKD